MRNNGATLPISCAIYCLSNEVFIDGKIGEKEKNVTGVLVTFLQ